MGHVWEQAVLPVRAGSRVLWSPCNTGPIAARRHVATLHDAAVLDHPEWFSKGFAALYAGLWPLLARRARIVTVSEFSRDRLATRLALPLDAITVVYNAADERFRPAEPSAIAEVRQRHGLGDGPYFLTLSTLEPRKNLPLVLRAWDKVGAGLSGARLVIAGAQGGRRVFAESARAGTIAREGVVETGHVAEADLPVLIAGARALLYPSLYEGFGLPVLEAMACGAAVVTTRCGALPEVGGDAVLYVDPHDETELAATMAGLYEDEALAAAHGAAGLARAKRFSWDAAARQMDAILAEAG
jgi:glycosyltransferase involved in cell wall biosynthesis